MAAPIGTTWGSPVRGNNGEGRIGIYVALSQETDTTIKYTVETWFWSKYSVVDSNNNFYIGKTTTSSGTASEKIGDVDIRTGNDAGSGWSTDNQQKIHSYSPTFDRRTTEYTIYFKSRLTNIDVIGGEMTCVDGWAIKAIPKYIITFYANGGTGEPSTISQFKNANATIPTTKPTRTGYTFKGWGTSATATTATYQPGDTITTRANTTLYAVWQILTYSVKFDANGGADAPTAQTKTHGVTLTLPSTAPTRSGYTFKGWGLSATSTTAAYQPGGSYTNNSAATLYAVWVLAYTKPRITNLSVTRCDSAGTESNKGIYALVKFNWACDKTISEIKIAWEASDVAEATEAVAASGTSGSVSKVVGAGALTTEKSYSFSIYVADANGYNYAFTTLPGSLYPIDVKNGGKGVSIGKPAELENIFEVAFATRLTGGFSPPVLAPEMDLNDVRTPNTYIGENVASYHYVNCPVTSGTFTLIVESGGDDGQVKQTYITCSKYKPETYTRFYYQNEWGDWFWASTDEVVLYENSDGAAGAITLSAAASHYRYIEIYYTDNNKKAGGYTKVWNPNGKSVCLHIQEPAATIYSRQTLYTISGTSMTPEIANAGYVKFSGTALSITTGTNYIRIVRVIGRA